MRGWDPRQRHQSKQAHLLWHPLDPFVLGDLDGDRDDDDGEDRDKGSRGNHGRGYRRDDDDDDGCDYAVGDDGDDCYCYRLCDECRYWHPFGELYCERLWDCRVLSQHARL